MLARQPKAASTLTFSHEVVVWERAGVLPDAPGVLPLPDLPNNSVSDICQHFRREATGGGLTPAASLGKLGWTFASSWTSVPGEVGQARRPAAIRCCAPGSKEGPAKHDRIRHTRLSMKSRVGGSALTLMIHSRVW